MKFSIPPEYCLIINAFNQTNSLRGAAVLLQMDPPSLVRKVQKISSEFGYLQKNGNRWAVTEAGRRVALWTEEWLQSQKEITQEKTTIRISSFAWLAEEMLIPEYPKLRKILKDQQNFTFRLGAAHQEQELIQGRTDVVIQGHAPTDPTIAYKKISSYPWVVVIPQSWKKRFDYLKESEIIQALQEKPYIRHADLNPENVLGFQPQTKATLHADAVIGIRSAVVCEEGWSALPAMSVHNYIAEKKISKLNVPTFIKDDVSIWWIRARKDLAEPSRALSRWISEFKIKL